LEVKHEGHNTLKLIQVLGFTTGIRPAN